MNNYFHNEDKKTNKRIAINAFLILIAIVVSGIGAYFLTNIIINPTYDNKASNNIEEKTVYNNTKSLEDDVVIVLMSEGVIEKEETVGEFKKNNSITTDVSEQFIVDFFLADGYKLEVLEDAKVVFEKENTTLVLEPNKYYIGEKDGYFAIYKTDNEGKPTIESEKDIYRNSRPISFLEGSEDFNQIKNFKNCYDTKEEAVEKLSAYLS